MHAHNVMVMEISSKSLLLCVCVHSAVSDNDFIPQVIVGKNLSHAAFFKHIETALQQSMSFLYVIMYKCQNCHQYINRSTSICLKTNNSLLIQHYHNNAFKNMQMSPEMHKPQVALIICNICILFPSQEVTQYKHRADVNFIRNLPDWLLLLSLYTTGF